MESIKTRIQKLRGPQDYQIWKDQMKYYLIGLDLWSIVDKPTKKPKVFITPEDIAARQRWVEQNNKAFSAIMLNVSMEVAVGLDNPKFFLFELPGHIAPASLLLCFSTQLVDLFLLKISL